VHENESSPSNQPDHITAEQIPHSGIHHDERPVDEFDHTSLPEAVERGLVNPTPDTAAELEPAEQASSTEKKSHKKLVIGGAAFLAGAAVIAGSVIGLKAAGDAPKNTPPAPDPKATSQTPEATPTAAPEVLTVASLEIPAGLTPEQLGQTLVADRLSAWAMAGSIPDVQNQWLDYVSSGKGSTGAFVDGQVATNGAFFAEALFVPGFKSDALLTDQVSGWTKQNATLLEDWLLTYNSHDPKDLEPFNDYFTVESTTVVSQTTDSITLAIAATDHNNAAQNRIGSQYDPGAVALDGYKFVMTVTLTSVGGAEKISAIHY
jgi:hypothetical protein